jgi:hypothetical protein
VSGARGGTRDWVLRTFPSTEPWHPKPARRHLAPDPSPCCAISPGHDYPCCSLSRRGPGSRGIGTDLFKIGRVCLIFLSSFLAVGSGSAGPVCSRTPLLVQEVRFADSDGVHRPPEVGGGQGVVEQAWRRTDAPSLGGFANRPTSLSGQSL